MLEYIPVRQVRQRLSEGWQIVSQEEGDYAALMRVPAGWEPVFRNSGDMARHYVDGGKVRAVAKTRNTQCTLPDCDGKHHARGYCTKHYRRFKITGSPRFVCKPGPRAHGECDFPKCRRKSTALGMCNRHYLRYRAAEKRAFQCVEVAA